MVEFNRSWISLEDMDNEDTPITNEETGEVIQDTATETAAADDDQATIEQETQQEDEATVATRNIRDLTNYVRTRAKEEPLTEAEVILFKNNVATNMERARVPQAAIESFLTTTSFEGFGASLEPSLESAAQRTNKAWTDLKDSLRGTFGNMKNSWGSIWNSAASMRKNANELRKLIAKLDDKIKPGKEKLPEGSFSYFLADTKTQRVDGKNLIQNFRKEMVKATSNLDFPLTWVSNMSKNLESILDDLAIGKASSATDIPKMFDTIAKNITGQPAKYETQGKRKTSIIPLPFGNQAIHATYTDMRDVEDVLFSFNVFLDKYHKKNNVANNADTIDVPALSLLRQIPDILDEVANNIERWTDKTARRSSDLISTMAMRMEKMYTEQIGHGDQSHRITVSRHIILNARRLIFICSRQIVLANAIAIHSVKCGNALADFGKRAAKHYQES